ncbi:MAG TPA: sulfate transporter CysZ [Pseudomonadales bacterium]|nr:sulfate transporter CysZ [Pseudomonadales bacterium]
MSTTRSIDYLREGFRLLGHPELRGYVLVPLLLNTLVFGGLFAYSLHEIGLGIHWAVQALPQWLDWLSWILWPMAVLLVLLIVMYTFSSLANLLAAPFNGLLAEKTEELLTGKAVNNKENFAGALRQLPGTFRKELHKLGFQLRWIIPLLVVSVIPGLNMAAPMLWFVFGAWMTAVEYCDYPMDNHNIAFADVRKNMRGHRWQCFSFGSLVMMANMVPLLNLLVMPAAVCAATLLFVEQMSGERLRADV